MEKIRFATIGTSSICEDFLDIACKHPNLTYIATYSRQEDNANDFSKKYGSKFIFTDLNKLANCDEIDAVYIASPNSLHYEQALQMLQAGKHVFLEKPFCTNFFQARKLFEIAESKSVALLEAMRPIHDIGFSKLKDCIHEIAPIRKCYLNYSKYSSKYDEYKNGMRVNIFDPKFSSGALMDIGVYPVEFMVALFGEPNTIVSQTFLLKSGVDGATSAIAGYDDFYCIVDSAKTSTSEAPCVIEGENGSIYLPYIRDVERFTIKWRDNTETIHQREECRNTFRYEVDAFVKMVQSGLHYEKYKEISLITMRVLDEIRKQSRISFPDDSIQDLDS